MRHTNTPEDFFPHSVTIQTQLDAFWELIENNYEEQWHVEYNGDVVLVVDDAMLERILNDNVAVAWFKFGSNRGGETPDGLKYFTSRPEYLKGLWRIEGIYTANQTYVGGPRSYHFEPGEY